MPPLPADPRLLARLEAALGARYRIAQLIAAAPSRLLFQAMDTLLHRAVSLRVAFHSEAAIVRRVPASVFWPPPNVDSVLVRLTPHAPPVDVDPVALFRVIEEGFAERRKTMANAIRRLGCQLGDAIRILRGSDVDSEEETWFDLTQPGFEPVFSFPVRGHQRRSPRRDRPGQGRWIRSGRPPFLSAELQSNSSTSARILERVRVCAPEFFNAIATMADSSLCYSCYNLSLHGNLS